MKTLKRALIACAFTAAALAAATAAPAGQSDLSKARQATAAYHDLDAAKAGGYGLFTDAAGVECIDQPGEGAMGVHYVKGALVGDGAVDPRKPEALVYEPRSDGRLKLVAVEYVVFHSDWHREHIDPPSLFGREFTLVGAGNRYGLPPFYELHAWIWANNPNGMFRDWNPRVSC